MSEEMRTFGYLCPACGQTVMGTRSVFALEASNAEIECSCGKSSLDIGFDGEKYHITVPCGICGETHTAICGPERILQGATALGCAQTKQFCCFIGPEGMVEKNLRELELRLHQEQISPHFLYNTLDSIVWMAEGGNNRQVVEMTTDLSDFFRTVLSGGRDFITIEEEESHIRSYLKIQKIRYEDILDYSIEIEPSIRHRIVLKMLLQPLVENALYHGIKNKRGGGCIVFRGYEDRNGLVFEVEDDGIGMDEAELAAVRAKLTLEPEEELAPIGSGGFGLHNVVQRIQMYYGDQAEILVESEKNIGTCFKVYLGNQKKS